MPGNQLGLVMVKGVTRDGHAILDAGDFCGDKDFRPLLYSWYLSSIHEEILAQLTDVPNGEYWYDIIIRDGCTSLFKQGLLSATPHYWKKIKLPRRTEK